MSSFQQIYETFFQQSPSPTIIVRADAPRFTIVASNEQHKIATNYVGERMEGKGTWEVFTPEDENRQNEFAVLMGGLMESLTLKKIVELPLFRYDMPSNDGHSFDEAWWRLKVIPLMDQYGNVEYLMALTNNITTEVKGSIALERVMRQEEMLQREQALNEELASANEELKQYQETLENVNIQLEKSEKQFRFLLNTIPQIAWTNTTEGDVTFYNQRWYDYTGLDFDETKAWGWKKVIHPDDLQYNLTAFTTILASETGGEFEIREKRFDGEYRWHLVRIVPFKNDQGEIKSWIGTATDIHEIKMLQQQKDDFITIASHELKTPVTTLKASLQLLSRIKNNPSSERLPELIDQANKSMERVSTL
ncbi:MAG: PAS domain S-box protein, partial [Chitinophagaceae bacterium]|nr:PAS domain S-box protein [Chitinophagaceae bacterium]